MPRRRLASLAAAMLLASAQLSAQAPAGSAFAITRVQAKLYFPQTATFSDDMLAAQDLSLWNSIIGAGWAKHPSNATMVLVEVSGDPKSSQSSPSVELTVTDARNGSVKMRRRGEMGPNDTPRQQVAFWLYDTGCLPLVLRARLIGQASPSLVEKKIPFECGE